MAEKAEKLSRKQLKAPDEFQKIGAQAVPFMVQHQKTVVMGVVGLVLLGGAVALGSYFNDRKETSARQALGKALELLDRPVKGQPSDSEAAESNDETPFKTEADKLTAEVTALDAFRAKHPGTRSAGNAGLVLGEALLREGKGKEAVAAFDDYLAHSDPNDPLRPAALEGKGYAYEQSKEYDQALSAFDQLSKDTKTDFMKGMGLYHRARILLLQGKTEEGAKALSEVPSLAPNTAAARLAQERIVLLTAQGVKVPASPPPVIAADAG
jgi:tetratricopeptide (TPR) repeat protein